VLCIRAAFWRLSSMTRLRSHVIRPIFVGSNRPASIAESHTSRCQGTNEVVVLPAKMRAVARRGEWRGSTGGQCSAYQQANLVILPKDAGRIPVVRGHELTRSILLYMTLRLKFK